MLLPDELKLHIYKNSDIETRIKLNKEFNWNFKIANPYYDYKFNDYMTQFFKEDDPFESQKWFYDSSRGVVFARYSYNGFTRIEPQFNV
jgi:hypothetical protein